MDPNKGKTIYDLNLHELFILNSLDGVMRVAGGWIYMIGRGSGGVVFVPFDNEFQLTSPSGNKDNT